MSTWDCWKGRTGGFLPSFCVSSDEKLLVAVELNWLTGLKTGRIPEAQGTDVDARILYIRARIACGGHFGEGDPDGVRRGKRQVRRSERCDVNCPSWTTHVTVHHDAT